MIAAAMSVREVALAHERRTFLERVSFDVVPGELLALVGPNGVGKTSLLRALAGLSRVQSGTIVLGDRPIAAFAPAERARAIALLEAQGSIPDHVSAYEIVCMGRLPFRPWWRWTQSIADRDAVDRAISRLEIGDVAARSFETLSSGAQQRVWMAMAIAQDAKLLLLDEPTSHLDVRHAFELLDVLRGLTREGCAAVVVLHDLNLASGFADKIMLLGEGTALVCGTPQQALDEDVLRRAYGVSIRVRREPDGRVFSFADPGFEQGLRGRGKV